MNGIYFLILFVFSIQSSKCQDIDTIFLWPNKVPGVINQKHLPVELPNINDNVMRITDITNPALLVFNPVKTKNNGVGIIICPGGGYKYLAIDKEGFEIAAWLNELGYTAFVLQYRVPGNRNGALHDIQRGIRLVRSNFEKYKLNKLGVIGFSAGGHLCSVASNNANTYQKQDEIDELTCMPDFSILIYPAYLDKEANIDQTLNNKFYNTAPPTFIFATADDKHGNGSIYMAKTLSDASIPVEFHLLSEGGHGYGLRSGNVAAETWPRLCEIWLKSILGKMY